MIKPIPRLIHSDNPENNPFDINRLTNISIENDGYGKPVLYFYLDTEECIKWKFTSEKERSNALSEIYKLTNAVKI